MRQVQPVDYYVFGFRKGMWELYFQPVNLDSKDLKPEKVLELSCTNKKLFNSYLVEAGRPSLDQMIQVMDAQDFKGIAGIVELTLKVAAVHQASRVEGDRDFLGYEMPTKKALKKAIEEHLFFEGEKGAKSLFDLLSEERGLVRNMPKNQYRAILASLNK